MTGGVWGEKEGGRGRKESNWVLKGGEGDEESKDVDNKRDDKKKR